jgi:hypothetical protein
MMHWLSLLIVRRLFTKYSKLKGLYEYDNIQKEHLDHCPVCEAINSFLKPLFEIDRYGFNAKTVFCEKCGLVFINPRISLLEYGDFYNAGHYRKLINEVASKPQKSHDCVSDRLSPILKILVSRYQSKPISVIDIGGTFEVFCHLEERIDIDDYVCINPGKGESKSSSPKFVVENTTLEEYHGQKKYDLVIMFGTISHLMYPRTAFEKIRSFLKDDGVLVFDFKDTIKRMENVSMPFLYIHFDHPLSFSRDSLNYLIMKTGFKITEIVKENKLLSYYFLSKTRNISHLPGHADLSTLEKLTKKCPVNAPVKCITRIARKRLSSISNTGS